MIKRTCPACGRIIDRRLAHGGTFFTPTKHCPFCKTQLLPNDLSQGFWWLGFLLIGSAAIFFRFANHEQHNWHIWLACAILATVAALWVLARVSLRYQAASPPP